MTLADVLCTRHGNLDTSMVPIAVREAVAERLGAMGIDVEWDDFYEKCDGGCLGEDLDECSFCRRDFSISESRWLPTPS